MSERNATGTRFGTLRQRIMGLDPNTIGTVLSLLPTILEQANKTIDKFKNRKKTGTEPARGEGAAPDPNTRIAELEAAIDKYFDGVAGDEGGEVPANKAQLPEPQSGYDDGTLPDAPFHGEDAALPGEDSNAKALNQ